MTRILLTGATGLLGRRLHQRLSADHEIVGTGWSRAGKDLLQVDLRDSDALAAMVHSIAPEVILHTAAERRPDVAIRDPEGTRELNVGATASLARAGRQVAWLLHFSTDYVFDGTHPPYHPGSQPNPLNLYGRSKLQSEQAVWKATENAAVLRVPILYGQLEHPRESINGQLLEVLRSRRPQALDHWATRYPTWTDDVAQVVHQMLQLREEGNPMTGTFHWSSPEAFTKYTMARTMAEALGLDAEHLSPDPEPAGGEPRPRDSRLDCSRLQALGVGHHTPWAQAIRILHGSSSLPFQPR